MYKDIVLIGQENTLDSARKTFDDSFVICSQKMVSDNWTYEIKEKKESNDAFEIVVCATNYLDIGKVLFDEGFDVYYVCIDGLLFRCDKTELMSPVELYHNTPYRKGKKNTKTIVCFRTEHALNEKRIVNYIKNRGYEVILLTTDYISEGDYILYDGCYKFTSMREIQEFVKNSDVDLVHCFTGTNVLASLYMLFNLPFVYEMDIGNINITNLVLEYSIYRFCAGIVFDNARTKEIYEKQFGNNYKPYLLIEYSQDESEGYIVERNKEEDFYAIVESTFKKI